MTVQAISLDGIRAEIQAQPRAAMLTDEVARYSEAMASGAEFPPLVVYFDGAIYWLADGFHRYHAARGLGLASFDCDVRDGGLRDAVLHSVGANEAHGIRRTNEDKKRAVKRLLDDPEWSQWSDREIARRCGVSQPFVSGIRPVITDNIISEPRTYTNKHGSISSMAVSNIGRRVAADAGPRPLPAYFGEGGAPAPAQPAPPTIAAFYSQGNASIFNDLTDVRRMMKRLPKPELAVEQFPDRARHDFSAEDFDWMAAWFTRAAEAWRNHEEATHVAAE